MKCLIKVIFIGFIFVDAILCQVTASLVTRLLRIRVRFPLLLEFIRERLHQVATYSA